MRHCCSATTSETTRSLSWHSRGSAFLQIDGKNLSNFRWGEYRADLLKGVSAAKALVALEEYIGTELPWEITQYMDGKVLVLKQGGPGVNP